MSDEAANRLARTPDSGRPASGGDGLGSPLQTRAAFLKNWDWLAVVSINRGACERSRAQHGINSETGAACAADWQKLRRETLTLGETLDRLRVIENPIRVEPQEEDRFRFWGKAEEFPGRFLRVVTLADRVTIHNAFLDRRFKP